MTPKRLLRVCLATGVAALLCACGTDGPDSNDELAGADVGGTKAADCADLLGRTVTAGFAGCDSGGRFIKATSTACADGRTLIAPDLGQVDEWTEAQVGESVWGFVGQPFQAGAGDGELHATMFIDCNDF